MPIYRLIYEVDASDAIAAHAFIQGIAPGSLMSSSHSKVRGPRGKGPWYISYKGQMINPHSDYMAPMAYRFRKNALWDIKMITGGKYIRPGMSIKLSDYKVVNV